MIDGRSSSFPFVVESAESSLQWSPPTMFPRRRSSADRLLQRSRNERDVSNWVQYNQYPGPEEPEPRLRVHFADKDHKDDDSSSESSTSTASTDEPVALDGGYGWYIVFISFAIHAICDGVSFSYGFIFMYVQKTYVVSRFLSSFIGSVFLAFPLLCSPIAGILTDIYDCRRITILGAAITTFGMVAASLAGNVYMFLLFFSVIGGFGMSFCYNTAIVMVTYYFDRRRSLATGIAVCGSGVGTSAVSFLLEYVTENWPSNWWLIGRINDNLQRAVIVISCLFGALTLLAATMEDVEWSSDSTEAKKRRFDRKVKKIQADGYNGYVAATKDSVEMPMRHAYSLPALNTIVDISGRRIDPSASIQSIRNAVTNIAADQVARSVSVSTFRRRSRLPKPEYTMLVDLEHLDLQLGQSSSTTLTSRRRPRMLSHTSMSMDALNYIEYDNGDVNASKSTSGSSTTSSSKLSTDGESSSSEISEVEQKEKDLHETAQLLPVLITGTDPHLSVPIATSAPRPLRSSLKTTSAVANNMAVSRVPAYNAYRVRYMTHRSNLLAMKSKAPSAPTLHIEKKKKKTLGNLFNLGEHMDSVRQSMADWQSVMKNKMFCAFIFSVFMLYLCYDIPYVNFPEYAVEELGLTMRHVSRFMNALGIANTVGMVICGLVADRKVVQKHLFLFYGTLVTAAGVCIALSTFVTDFVGSVLVSVSFGLFISVNYALASVVCVTVLDLSEFQAGYSAQSFFTGIANLIGPPLIGFIRDHLSSYKWMLFSGGVGLVTSGVIVLAMYAYVVQHDFKWKEEHFEEDDEEEEGEKKEQKNGREKKDIENGGLLSNGI